MLTRLRVQGFKNLADLTIRFGPFTCFAGHNAVGKSNLFDAIRFLHLLSQKPIMEAVASLRDARGRAPSPIELFTRFGNHREKEMRFTADVLVNRNVTDEFGVEGKAAISTMRYEVAFRIAESEGEILELVHESLRPIVQSDARKSLRFPHSKSFRDSVVRGRRVGDLISMEAGQTIKVHQEGHGGRKLPAPKSTVTVVNGMGHSDFPSILAVKKEMAAWRTLMLEPSAMRSPSSYRDSRQIDSRGAFLANAVYRLQKSERRHGQISAAISNRLSQLIGDVAEIRVVEDERSETRTLELKGRDGAFHPAHSLSDGTLRFLVLTVLELDPEVTGLTCLEEPENGIHPERIGAIVKLLRDTTVDATEAVGEGNPLRQIIVNTHSPAVVTSVPVNDLVYLGQDRVIANGASGNVATAFVPDKSWRAEGIDQPSRLVPGQILAYLGQGRPVEPSESEQYVFDWVNATLKAD